MNTQTNSTNQTIKYGEKLATRLKSGDIILLSGDLGSGKTTFVKGLALGLGIKEEITSPTFTLMNVYKIPNTKLRNKKTATTLIHVDTYRLKNDQELVDIGIEDYLGEKNTICVIEWPEKLTTLLKNIRQRWKIISVDIEHLEKNKRRILVSKE